jgi:hypothetical protein
MATQALLPPAAAVAVRSLLGAVQPWLAHPGSSLEPVQQQPTRRSGLNQLLLSPGLPVLVQGHLAAPSQGVGFWVAQQQQQQQQQQEEEEEVAVGPRQPLPRWQQLAAVAAAVGPGHWRHLVQCIQKQQQQW